MKISTTRYSQDLRRYYRMPAVQISLTVVLSIFLIAVFVVFALRPTIISIVNLRKTISESEKTLEQLKSKVVDLQKASAQLETLKPFLPILNTNIPNNGAMYSPLTKAVELLANQTGVKIDSESIGGTLLFSRLVAPFTPNKNQKVVALPFSLRIIGGYESISNFLVKLLTMERLVMVDSLTLTRETATKTSSAVVGLNISGSAYYLADEIQLQKSMADKKGKK